eukprot:sb/3473952/
MHRQQQRGRGGLERFIHFHCNWLSLFSARFSAHWLNWSVFSTIFSRLVELVALKKRELLKKRVKIAMVMYESLFLPLVPFSSVVGALSTTGAKTVYPPTVSHNTNTLSLSLSFTLQRIRISLCVSDREGLSAHWPTKMLKILLI